MIDLSLTAGRLTIRLTWNRQAEPAKPSAPINAGYPMRVTAAGFTRRTVRTNHEDEEA